MNPCIKYRAMNLKGSQDKDKETKENKDYKTDGESQRERETGRQTYTEFILPEVNGVSDDNQTFHIKFF